MWQHERGFPILIERGLFMITESVAKKNNTDLGERKVIRRAYSVNSQNKDALLQFRVTQEEKDRLTEIARNRGVSLSNLIMNLLSVAFL